VGNARCTAKVWHKEERPSECALTSLRECTYTVLDWVDVKTKLRFRGRIKRNT
jgi:hypothetical protein